jgi:hypothetical protein
LGGLVQQISRELKRNALESGAYRPVPAEGAYLLRRQGSARLEKDGKLRGYVLVRLSEGWTPERISRRRGQGIEIGLGLISTEAIYAWIYSKARKADGLWRSLTRGRPRRGRCKRASKDRVAEKIHISKRTEAANQREELGHWGEEGPWPLVGPRKPAERFGDLQALAPLTGAARTQNPPDFDQSPDGQDRSGDRLGEKGACRSSRGRRKIPPFGSLMFEQSRVRRGCMVWRRITEFVVQYCATV